MINENADTSNNANIENAIELKNQIKELELKLQEKEENILDLGKIIKELQNITSKLEKDNESLVESQQYISDYVNSIKNSNADTVNDLNTKILKLQTTEKDLQQVIECQQYLHDKLLNKINHKNNHNENAKKISRDNSLSTINKIDLQSIGKLQKIFEANSFDPNLGVMIGIELEEDNPGNFLEKINQLKTQREFYHATADKFEGIVNDIKAELKEKDESNLMKLICRLKKESKSFKYGYKK